MIPAVPPTPRGDTVFCDDIRQETNNKRIYVGVYSGEMTVYGTAPAALAKLALAITYVESHKEIGPPATLKVYAPDGEGGDAQVARVEIPIEQMAKIPRPQDVSEADAIISAVMIVELVPLVLKGPGHIKVRVEREGKEHRIGSMRIKFDPTASLPPDEQLPPVDQA